MSDEKVPVANKRAEIDAMGAIADALADLDVETESRVLRWAIDSYGVAVGGGTKPRAAAANAQNSDTSNGNGGTTTPIKSRFSEIGEFYSAISPTTDADKALVVAYWLQWGEERQDFAAYDVNTALKHLGEGVSNITTALDTLKARKPAPVIQLKKAGTSKQARKTYKVTLAGKNQVEMMVGQQQ